LDGFVPTVDTTAENKLRAIRSRITSERRWKLAIARDRMYCTCEGITRGLSFIYFLTNRINLYRGVNARYR